MNLPNKITIFRILLVPVFVVSMIINKTNNLWPCIIFIVASVTDTLDGNIARKYNLVTTFGKFMDPLADKILTAAAFIMLVELEKVPAWVCIIKGIDHYCFSNHCSLRRNNHCSQSVWEIENCFSNACNHSFIRK